MVIGFTVAFCFLAVPTKEALKASILLMIVLLCWPEILIL